MGTDPVILLGVGATKSGTTWLYDHLRAHPQCHLRSIKELHYFDTLESGAFQHQLRVQRALAQRLGVRAAVATGQGLERVARRQGDVADWINVLSRRTEDVNAYLHYLFGGGWKANKLVADITPAYALLPVERLRAMATMAPDVRFLYLLRDPVARLWSHVRMLAQRAGAAADRLETEARELLNRILDGARSGAVDRSDYAGAITRLRAAVAPSRLMVMFQDDLMTVPGLARLCTFLGIDAMSADFDRRVFTGGAAGMTPEQARRARAFLAPQYAFVEKTMGGLPASWQTALAEGSVR